MEKNRGENADISRHALGSLPKASRPPRHLGTAQYPRLPTDRSPWRARIIYNGAKLVWVPFVKLEGDAVKGRRTAK
jgi:hypothetical protein